MEMKRTNLNTSLSWDCTTQERAVDSHWLGLTETAHTSTRLKNLTDIHCVQKKTPTYCFFLSLQIWLYNYVIGRNEYLISTLSESTVYSLQLLSKSTHHSWRYERKCGWVFLNTVYNWAKQHEQHNDMVWTRHNITANHWTGTKQPITEHNDNKEQLKNLNNVTWTWIRQPMQWM